MTFVLPLTECSPEHLGLVGGKAVGLGALFAHGLPVPAGFVVTTEAYRHCLGADALEAQVRLLLDGLDDTTDNEAVSLEIGRLFENAGLDSAVGDQIADAYKSLGDGTDVPVAVRSSATAEDAADASFAGQQDTYLWITGVEEVTRHVLRCWSSLYTARAIGYRSRFGVDGAGLAMGVVVQTMVEAEAAGVMMTLDPVTGDRSQLYIESALGYGEAVVRGEVSPDKFWVAKSGLALTTREIGYQTIAYVVRDTGSTAEMVRVELPTVDHTRPSLSDAEAVAVADLGLQVERAFGAPMDVEWAIGAVRNGAPRTVFLVQARPETVWSRRDPAQSLGNDGTGDDS